MPTRYIGDGYWELISRQMSIVTRSQQERFKEAKIAVYWLWRNRWSDY